MSSMFFYIYAPFQLIVGVLVDKWEPRKVLTLFVFIMSLGTLIFAYSPSLPIIFLGRVLIGVGCSGIFIPMPWIIMKYFAYEKRGFLGAIFIFSGNIGFVLATLPFAKLINFSGWRSALAYVAFISFGLAVLLWFFVGDNNSNKIKETQLDNKDIENLTKRDEKKASWFTICKELFSTPIIRYCVISCMFYAGAQMSFQGLWAVSFLIDVYKMGKTSASDCVTIIPVGLMLGILLLGRFYDTKYGKLLFMLGPVSSLILYLSFFLYTDKFIGFNVFKILFFIWGFCQGADPYILKVYSLILPEKYYGSAVGIMNLFPIIGCALYQSFTGLLFDLSRGGTDVLNRSVGSYKLYFLFLTLSLIIVILAYFKIIKILNKDYKVKV